MGGGSELSSSISNDDDWEQSLFRPPAWPFGRDTAAAKGPGTAYGHDLRALGRLPQQAGAVPRRPAPCSTTATAAADDDDERAARAYYRQFAVFRAALATTAPPDGGRGAGKAGPSAGAPLRVLRALMLVCAALVVACELAAYVCIRLACDRLGRRRGKKGATEAGAVDAVDVAGAARRLREARARVERGGGGGGRGARRAARRLCGELLGGGLAALGGRWRSPAAAQYADEVVLSLACVRRAAGLDAAERLAVGRAAERQLGGTALCLSGGAAQAWKHLGVARRLLDRGCLPRVLSGASAGSVVAALLATHTDAELRRILHPGFARYLTACQDPWRRRLRRWAQTGALFDPLDWALRAQVFTRGAMTFAEAYRRTGRALSIPCAPLGRGPARVLNHVTAPDVLVWSAVLASACLPGILPPTVLLRKASGRVTPHVELGAWWRDGSFQCDIPGAAVGRVFNVGSVVVSQVNPHVAWFLRRAGATGLAHGLLLDVRKTLRWACDLGVLPAVAGQDWSCVWLQRFHGDVTLLPAARVAEVARLLSDPTERHLERCFADGARAVEPWVAAVATRRAVEDAVARLVDEAGAAEAAARTLHCRVDSGVDHAEDQDSTDHE
ncbi:hypothetical protein LPJ53_003699 [Coemansia erecta]|uniref:PNPLA domain-containing protein n=1 Tax=Coemansia erecta TaxID=147472 RepID=A0A9W7Y0R1_9FUNG|nr:hypothetical protein LPJ53_003699 [Coemansia erecta]